MTDTFDNQIKQPKDGILTTMANVLPCIFSRIPSGDQYKDPTKTGTIYVMFKIRRSIFRFTMIYVYFQQYLSL